MNDTRAELAAMRTSGLATYFERFNLHTETLLLLTAAFIVALANLPFWDTLLANDTVTDWHSWRYGIGIFTALTAFHFVFLGVLAPRPALRPVLSAVVVISILTSYYMRHLGILIDPGMVRNILSTDWREARELLSVDMFAHMLLALIPLGVIWLVRLKTRSTKRAVGVRFACLGLAVLIGVIALMLSFKEFSSTMREQHSIRYMLTPGNVIWSLGKVIVDDRLKTAAVPESSDPAARLLPAAARKPTLLVMVVGETARAANFGLNGYARNNTPQLAAREVINFPNTTSCGTSTEVSLPCMFSPFGRRHYDEKRIRNHESLLHLVDRAGVKVSWLDNQSGCKGVCRGLDFDDLGEETDANLCTDGHCHDEILLQALKNKLSAGGQAPQDRMVVLHQLGNHGPAYFRRYPSRFELFTPACKDTDLGKCGSDEIVNAYDNAIAYTDHLLAGIIDFLASQEDKYDVAMIYVSDHGESLGEHGLFLHGVPYAIAPQEQTHVPMVWWIPKQSAHDLDVNTACLRDRGKESSSHDNLFSSILGLLHIDTPVYEEVMDLTGRCRSARHSEVASTPSHENKSAAKRT